MAIALERGLKKTACLDSGAGSTASYFTSEYAPGKTVPTADGVSIDLTSVRDKVNKTVETLFTGAIGVDSNAVTATAKATWGGLLNRGRRDAANGCAVVHVQNNLPPATTLLLLRSDVISVVSNVLLQ